MSKTSFTSLTDNAIPASGHHSEYGLSLDETRECTDHAGVASNKLIEGSASPLKVNVSRAPAVLIRPVFETTFNVVQERRDHRHHPSVSPGPTTLHKPLENSTCPQYIANVSIRPLMSTSAILGTREAKVPSLSTKHVQFLEDEGIDDM